VPSKRKINVALPQTIFQGRAGQRRSQ
jgi:hypothetical protein